jgi:hypothetical protein
MHRHAVEDSTYPRGPRSGPGCSVPVRHHLIGPIRPTRRRTAISPHGGLYVMPSLCGSAYRSQLPAVDDVADEVDHLGIMIPQEIEQEMGLAAARTEMHVGDGEGAKPPHSVS